jgi:hypothetical protein
MALILSPPDTQKYLAWLTIAYEYGNFTDDLVESLYKYFPNKQSFDLALPDLKELAMDSLPQTDKDFINQTSLFLRKKNKTQSEKEQMIMRARILSKVRQALSRLRSELFPPQPDLSDSSPSKSSPKKSDEDLVFFISSKSEHLIFNLYFRLSQRTRPSRKKRPKMRRSPR